MDKVLLQQDLEVTPDDFDYLQDSKEADIKERIKAVTYQFGVVGEAGDPLKIVPNIGSPTTTVDINSGKAIDPNGDMIIVRAVPGNEVPPRPSRSGFVIPDGTTKFFSVKYAEITDTPRTLVHDPLTTVNTRRRRSYQFFMEDIIPSDPTKIYLGRAQRSGGSITITDERVMHSVYLSILGATTTYVDTKVAKSGDTMTGYLTLAADPIDPRHAASKLYVDTTVAGGLAWQEDKFTVTSPQSIFTLSHTALRPAGIIVTINGLLRSTYDYTVGGDNATITFNFVAQGGDVVVFKYMR